MKKRNIIIIALIIIVVFAIYETQNDKQNIETTEENNKEVVAVENSENNINYKLVQNDTQKIGKKNKYSIIAVTNEKLDGKEIQDTLMEIKSKEIKSKDPNDDIYIFLNDSELITGSGYTLGSLTRRDKSEVLEFKNKDWSKQPTELDYTIFNRMNELSMEGHEEEKEIINIISEESNLKTQEVESSIDKVNTWLFMDIK